MQYILNIPIIGWASAIVEVEDDDYDNVNDILAEVINGTLDISDVKLEQWSLEDKPDSFSYENSGYPSRTEIN